MVSKKIATGLDPALVIPQVVDDEVCCECGSPMEPWEYVAVPSGWRSILWRCTINTDHVSSMIPLPKENK